MTISWRTEEYKQDNGDIHTRVFIQMINTSADALERIEDGLAHVRDTEFREVSNYRRKPTPGHGRISLSDFTQYEWDDQTYTGVLLLQLIGVDKATYKTRVGQLLDLTQTGMETNNDI